MFSRMIGRCVCLHLCCILFNMNFPNLSKYIHKFLEYPEIARKCGIEGIVKASVMLNADGKVMSVRILEGIGYGCDEAVVQLFCNMPVWRPTMKNGWPKPQRLIVPVHFRLR